MGKKRSISKDGLHKLVKITDISQRAIISLRNT